VHPGAATYYNLTVSQLHTYAVGKSRAVVHNTGDLCDPQVLRHYTTEEGYNDITRTGQIKVSNSELDPVHARHGTGVYFTDLTPEGGFTQGKISRRLWNNPFVMRARKLNYFVDVDVTGLGAIEGAPNNFLVSAQNISIVARDEAEFGDFTGRIVRGGLVGW
jgi:ADP-ribosyltransferase of polymorphic toxin system